MKLDSAWKVILAVVGLYVGFHIPEILAFLKNLIG